MPLVDRMIQLANCRRRPIDAAMRCTIPQVGPYASVYSVSLAVARFRSEPGTLQVVHPLTPPSFTRVGPEVFLLLNPQDPASAGRKRDLIRRHNKYPMLSRIVEPSPRFAATARTVLK